MSGITSGWSFESTQKLQNNQDVWIWIYRVRSLWFQMWISLQLDDAHYIKRKKKKAPSFPHDKQNLRPWKYSAQREQEGIMCCLCEKTNKNSTLLQKYCIGASQLGPSSVCPCSPAWEGPESTWQIPSQQQASCSGDLSQNQHSWSKTLCRE